MFITSLFKDGSWLSSDTTSYYRSTDSSLDYRQRNTKIDCITYTQAADYIKSGKELGISPAQSSRYIERS